MHYTCNIFHVQTKTKTAIKLAPPVRAGGRGGKRKISPGRQKIKVRILSRYSKTCCLLVSGDN